MRIVDHAGLAADRLEELARALAPLGMLHELIVWGLRSTPPRELVDVVVQDEYTHDVVFAFGEGVYLVFDTT